MGNPSYVPLTLEQRILQAIQTCGVVFNSPGDADKIFNAVLAVIAPKPAEEDVILPTSVEQTIEGVN